MLNLLQVHRECIDHGNCEEFGDKKMLQRTLCGMWALVVLFEEGLRNQMVVIGQILLSD